MVTCDHQRLLIISTHRRRFRETLVQFWKCQNKTRFLRLSLKIMKIQENSRKTWVSCIFSVQTKLIFNFLKFSIFQLAKSRDSHWKWWNFRFFQNLEKFDFYLDGETWNLFVSVEIMTSNRENSWKFKNSRIQDQNFPFLTAFIS